MSDPRDDETLAALARSDVNAFAELYRRHVTRVYRYQLIHTGNVRDAEDLTSQTFMAALDGIGAYRRAGVFAAWLMGIARRQMALHYRQRRPETALELAEAIPGLFPPLETLIGQRISLQQARAALKTLSADRAEVVIICIFGGLSVAEAAQALGKSKAAIKMLLSRGLQDLRTRTVLALEVEA